MGLRELNLKIGYETTAQRTGLLDDFYIPVLNTANRYYRIAGYFSSSALSVACEGIAGLINNGGKMYLIVSPELSKEDYEIIQEHGAVSDTMPLFRDFANNAMPDENLEALAWMLDNHKLEIRIVVDKITQTSIFHQKVGIVFDENGDKISFSGSINETAQAWLNNIEEFKVFKGWEQGQCEYVDADLKRFLEFWNNERKEIAEVYDIPDSIKKKILQMKPHDVYDLNIMRRYKKNKTAKKNVISLFPHQEAAVQSWIDHGYSLLMEMATGTGKTRTALACMTIKAKETKPLLVIVATPQNTLSRQWQKELHDLNIQLDRELIIDGSNPKWKKELEILFYDFDDRRIENAVIFTTHDTSSSDAFLQIVKQNKNKTKVLYIGDEVHAVGSSKQCQALLDEYEFRIGLSATPERMFDEEGSSLIRAYFGMQSFEFTISDALKTINPLTGKAFLNSYVYYPVFVPLTQQEEEKYRKISQSIVIMKAKDDYEPLDLQKLYDRRADIAKNADNKISVLSDLLDSFKSDDLHDIILFLSEKQIVPCFELTAKKNIRRAKITENESAIKIVSNEGNTERQEIIKQFAMRKIQILVGIKCLDEGIDIPNASTAILLSSSTNPREYVQRIGRVIRQAPDKPQSVIYDFIVTSENGKMVGVLEKESVRANYIASNAVNYDYVKRCFQEKGVELGANQSENYSTGQ